MEEECSESTQQFLRISTSKGRFSDISDGDINKESQEIEKKHKQHALLRTPTFGKCRGGLLKIRKQTLTMSEFYIYTEKGGKSVKTYLALEKETCPLDLSFGINVLLCFLDIL